MRKKALNLLVELDKIYAEALNGNNKIKDRINQLTIEILSFSEEELTDEIIGLAIVTFNQKVDLIYKICTPEFEDTDDLSQIRNDFSELEIKQFEINNNYILGTLTTSEIDEFKNKLFSFRDKLYAIEISDNNVVEIAKMKSKIQHYETEILEDEEILSQAYNNSN